MSNLKEIFNSLKMGALYDDRLGKNVGFLVFKKETETKEKVVEYAKKEMKSAIEMVSVKRYFEDGYEPEEIYYLTQKQSKKFDSLLKSLKGKIYKGEGGVVLLSSE